jgi:hypothetical protein
VTSSLRDVTIKVGRKIYHVRTSLDEESLARVLANMAEITGGLENSLDQEKLLLLLCLQLGWSLEKIRSRIDSVAEELEEI